MKIIRKIMATVTAAACVVAFNTVAVSSAFAASSNGTATVALTIIDNDDPNDPDIIANRYVTVSEDATVADMLAQAGFTETTSIEATSEPNTYYAGDDTYKYPYFAGKTFEALDDGSYRYWIDLYDGAMDNNSMTAINSTVVNGGHYQYVYGSPNADFTYNFSYSDFSDLISDPLSADAVNTYCSILPKKFTKKNIANVDWYMSEIETIFNALSNTEKDKVAYDITSLRGGVINAQNDFALDNVAKTTTVKAKANKKVTVTLKTVKSANGAKVQYIQKTKNAKITVSKAGKITVKKGLKKTASIKVMALCGIQSKNITVKVKAA